MHKLVSTTALAVTLISTTALANPATNSGNGGAAATTGASAAGSYSASHAKQHQRQKQVFNPTINVVSPTSPTAPIAPANVSAPVSVQATMPAPAVTTNVSAGGGGDRVPVASAIAPTVQYAANPCSGSAAAVAGQGPMFGFSVGTGGGFDNACRLDQLGRQDVAFAYLCQVNDDVRRAARFTSRPCPQDYAERKDEERRRPVPQAVSYSRPPWCSASYNYRDLGDRIELTNHPECR